MRGMMLMELAFSAVLGLGAATGLQPQSQADRSVTLLFGLRQHTAFGVSSNQKLNGSIRPAAAADIGWAVPPAQK